MFKFWNILGAICCLNLSDFNSFVVSRKWTRESYQSNVQYCNCDPCDTCCVQWPAGSERALLSHLYTYNVTQLLLSNCCSPTHNNYYNFYTLAKLLTIFTKFLLEKFSKGKLCVTIADRINCNYIACLLAGSYFRL